MRCIGAVRFQHAAQSLESRIGVRKMVQNSGADYLLEVRPKFACTLYWKLADMEIVQLVFALELFGMTQTRCAEVDAGDLGRRPAQGVLCRL